MSWRYPSFDIADIFSNMHIEMSDPELFIRRAERTASHEFIEFDRQPRLFQELLKQFAVEFDPSLEIASVDVGMQAPSPLSDMSQHILQLELDDPTLEKEAEKAYGYLESLWRGTPFKSIADDTDDYYCPRIVKWLRGDYLPGETMDFALQFGDISIVWDSSCLIEGVNIEINMTDCRGKILQDPEIVNITKAMQILEDIIIRLQIDKMQERARDQTPLLTYDPPGLYVGEMDCDVIVDLEPIDRFFNNFFSSRSQPYFVNKPRRVNGWTHPLLSSVQDRLFRLQDMTALEDFRQLKEDIWTLSDSYGHHHGIILDVPSYRPFSQDINEVDRRMQEVFTKYYAVPIRLHYGEVVNGYHLFDSEVDYGLECFEEWLELWNHPEQPTKEEFLEWYDNNACSDWSKQDRHGECFAGFWKYPEGSYEKMNAWELSRADNGEGLWELPYPKKFIQRTVKVGCGNRMESVRFSNFMCVWMQRKMAQQMS